MPFQLPSWWNWKVTYAIVLVVMLSLLSYALGPAIKSSPAVTASVSWGIVTLILCLIFMLGAAATAMQFLVFFSTGAFGAGMGYLVGAWLTPNAGTNPLDQVRNIVAGVLTGVVGTKLLTLWDDLVDRPVGGGPPPIMTAPYFIPIVMWLVGFTVSLSAFYTIRTGQSGDVRVTFTPQHDVLQLGSNHLGVLPETAVQFAGAANSPVDVTVSWDFHIEDPCGPPVPNSKQFNKAAFDREMIGAFDKATGKLTTPTQPVLQDWINSCPGSQNWILTATSNQDRSKFFQYNVKFCRTKQDCPVVGVPATQSPTAPGSSGTPVGGSAPGPSQPSSAPPNSQAAGAKEENTNPANRKK